MHQSEQDPEFLMTQHIKIEQELQNSGGSGTQIREKKINFPREINEKIEREKTKRILP
jgi:hypothetical protein